jgi:arylsulfatase A-like enzyme
MRPNILLVVSDTLRLDYLRCYGNEGIVTPNIDALAGRSVRFTNAFPESLPTIPVRRALHTGRRAYPFDDYRPVKWDIVNLPGWEPIDNEEDTLAENLAGAGYQTGICTDTLPYFAPGFNFTRGFRQWDFIRGQQQDRWRSPYSVPDEQLEKYGDPDEMRRSPDDLVRMHLANTAHVRHESDTSTARTFRSAIRFLEENVEGQPFYLLVDCFDPHEPWEAPKEYYDIYGDPNYSGRRLLFTHYGVASQHGYAPDEVEFVKAQYSGLVTLVDAWLGKLLCRLEELGLEENTVVILTSDHGTNFCENPRGVIGKPEYSMYPAVMRLPLLVHLPGVGREVTCSQMVYDTDITALIYEISGVPPSQPIDGRSLLPLLEGSDGWEERPWVTCRYGHSLCYIDSERWVLTDIDGVPAEHFDLEADPGCTRSTGEGTESEGFSLAWERLLADAGGSFPDYRESRRTDAIGRRGKAR